MLSVAILVNVMLSVVVLSVMAPSDIRKKSVFDRDPSSVISVAFFSTDLSFIC